MTAKFRFTLGDVKYLGTTAQGERVTARFRASVQVEIAGHPPFVLPIRYSVRILYGKQYPPKVDRLDRRRIPAALRPLVRQPLLEWLEGRYELAPNLWPGP